MNAGSIEGVLTLDAKQYFDTLKQGEKQAKDFSTNLQNAGKSMQTAGKTLMTHVSAPLIGVAGMVTKLGMDFESAMSQVQALSGETGEGMEVLEKKARDMGATTKFSATDAANAMGYMGMAGWNSKQMIEGLDGVMMLAAASGEDLAMVSDIVTDSLTGFGLKAEDAGRFADVLATASSKSNTNVAMMGETFKYVAPLAGALGYSVEDIALATGLMANAGIKGGKAGTALRASLSRLISPTKDSAEMIDNLGIKIDDGAGNMLPFRDLLDQLREKFKTLNSAQQAQYASTIFGQEAMSGMLAIINASDEDYTSLANSIDNSAGSAKKMSDIMQDNLKGGFQEFMSLVQEVGLQLYEVLLPALTDGLKTIKGWVQAFSDLDPKTKEMIVQIGGLAVALGPVLFVGGKFLSLLGGIGSLAKVAGTSLGLVAPAIGGVGTASVVGAGGLGALGAGFGGAVVAAAPFIAGIAGATAVGYGLYKGLSTEVIPEVDLFADHVSYASETIVDEFGNISTAYKDNTVIISEETQTQLESFFALTDQVSQTTSELYTGLNTNTTEGFATILETTDTAIGQLITASEKHRDEVIADYEELFANTTVISAKEQNEIINTVNQGHRDRVKDTEEQRARLVKIYEEIRKQHGEITTNQQKEINEIMNEMKVDAIKVMSENEIEQEVILNRLKNSSDRITTEMVSETIKEFNRQYDETVQIASDERDEIVRQAEQLKQEAGGKHSALANQIIEDANRQYEKVVAAADKTREQGFSKLESAHGDLANQVDRDTGNILTWWDKLKNWWNGWTPQSKTATVTTTNTTVNKTYNEPARSYGGDPGYGARRNARGTNFFPGGLTWVGEQGRELVELPRGSKIHSNPKSEKMVGGSNNTRPIQLQVPLYLDGHEIAKASVEYTAEELTLLMGEI